jgi:hypothetical protein
MVDRRSLNNLSSKPNPIFGVTNTPTSGPRAELITVEVNESYDTKPNTIAVEINEIHDLIVRTMRQNQDETKRLQRRIDQFLIALIAMCLAFGTAFGALMYHVGEERSQPVTPSTTEQLQPQPSPTQLPQN